MLATSALWSYPLVSVSASSSQRSGTSPESAAACPVLVGSGHLGWGEVPVVASDAPPPRVAPAPVLAAEDLGHSPTDRPRQQRAPPA